MIYQFLACSSWTTASFRDGKLTDSIHLYNLDAIHEVVVTNSSDLYFPSRSRLIYLPDDKIRAEARESPDYVPAERIRYDTATDGGDGRRLGRRLSCVRCSIGLQAGRNS